MRKLFRLPCNLAMKYHIVYIGKNQAAKLLESAGYVKMQNGIIRNISGSGLRFTSNDDLNVGDIIQCAFVLGNTAMFIKSKILEKQHMTGASAKFRYRVLFLDMTSETQDKIISYIFEEHLKQRKFKTEYIQS